MPSVPVYILLHAENREVSYDEFKIVDEHKLRSSKAFVVNGGYLLQATMWNKALAKLIMIFAVRKLFEKQFHAGQNTSNSGIQWLYDDQDSTKKYFQTITSR